MYYTLGIASALAGGVVGVWLIRQDIKPFVTFCDRLLFATLTFLSDLWVWLGIHNLRKLVKPAAVFLIVSWLLHQLWQVMPPSALRPLLLLFGFIGALVIGLLILMLKVTLMPVLSFGIYGLAASLLYRLPDHERYRASLRHLDELLEAKGVLPPVELAKRVAAALASEEMHDPTLAAWKQDYRYRKVERLQRMLLHDHGKLQASSLRNSDHIRAQAALMDTLVDYLKLQDQQRKEEGHDRGRDAAS